MNRRLRPPAKGISWKINRREILIEFLIGFSLLTNKYLPLTFKSLSPFSPSVHDFNFCFLQISNPALKIRLHTFSEFRNF